MKRHKNLFDKVVDSSNFYQAYESTAKGKRGRYEFLIFDSWLYSNMSKLRQAVATEMYRPQEPTLFSIKDPKPRSIVALKFPDRIVQHAIYSVIYPIFDRQFLPNSYACRKGYGSHRAARDVQAAMRKNKGGWYLKTDFAKYFKSVSRKILWGSIDRSIGCKRTKSLIERFVPRDGIGLGIGALLSQLFANVFGHIVDMYLKHTVKVKSFFRYMDDIVIIGRSKSELVGVKNLLDSYCSKIGLRFSKWFIKPLSAGVNFVGYRIWATHKLIRKDSISRAKRKLRTLTGDKRERFLASWQGHLVHANAYNLQKRMGIVE